MTRSSGDYEKTQMRESSSFSPTKTISGRSSVTASCRPLKIRDARHQWRTQRRVLKHTSVRLFAGRRVMTCKTKSKWSCWVADLIPGNICFLTFAGGYFTRLKRRTRQVISSGWVRTAGAPRSLPSCTRRRWRRER